MKQNINFKQISFLETSVEIVSSLKTNHFV